MQRIQAAFGVSIVLASCGAASAQVTIVSVARSALVHLCVHVPPDNSNWCTTFEDANATTGHWATGATYGYGASNATGHANAVAQGGQDGEVSESVFNFASTTDAWVESEGTCTSEAVVTASCVVRFSVDVPTNATVGGGVTNIGGTATVVIAPVGGGTLFSSTASSFHTQVLLPPGEYEFRAGSIANSGCDGACEHNLVVRVGVQVVFEPAPCRADFNGDGFLDFFDADAYLACFEGAECPPGQSADFDGDGFIDFFDVDAYIAAFEAGC